MKKSIGSLIFTAFVLFFCLIMVVTARDYGFAAWMFPVYVGIPMIGLGGFQLVRELRSSTKRGAERDLDSTNESDPVAIARARDKRRVLRYMLWTIGFFLGIWIFGFKLGAILFFVLFLHFEGGAKWWLNLILTGAAVFLILVQFGLLLSVHWPEGLIEQFITLPF